MVIARAQRHVARRTPGEPRAHSACGNATKASRSVARGRTTSLAPRTHTTDTSRDAEVAHRPPPTARQAGRSTTPSTLPVRECHERFEIRGAATTASLAPTRPAPRETRRSFNASVPTPRRKADARRTPGTLPVQECHEGCEVRGRRHERRASHPRDRRFGRHIDPSSPASRPHVARRALGERRAHSSCQNATTASRFRAQGRRRASHPHDWRLGRHIVAHRPHPTARHKADARQTPSTLPMPECRERFQVRGAETDD